MTSVILYSIPNLTQAKTPVFSSYTAQKSWFNSQTKIAIFSNASYIPGGRMIFKTISNNQKVTHVLVNYNGFDLYYTVQDFVYITENEIEFVITLDNWLTYKYQNDLTLGVGHVFRRGGAKPYYSKELSPIQYSVTYNNDLNPDIENLWVVVAAKSSGGNSVIEFWACKVGEVNAGVTPVDVISGNWIYGLNKNPTDVINAWLIGLDLDTYFGDNWNLTEIAYWYKSSDGEFFPNPININLKSSEYQHYVLCDYKGQIYLDFLNGQNITILQVHPILSATTFKLEIRSGIGGMVNGVGCYIPVDNLDIIVDDWTVYNAGQRQIDIDTANMNLNKQTLERATNIGSDAIGGGIGGALAGVPIIGAIAGLISGITSTVGGYAIQAYYNPKIQDLTDRGYKLGPDSLTLSTNVPSSKLTSDYSFPFSTMSSTYQPLF